MMLTGMLVEFARATLLLSTLSLAGLLIGMTLLRRNQLLFWCAAAALILHLGALSLVWAAGRGEATTREIPPVIKFLPTAPPPKPVTPPEKLRLPTGEINGDRQEKQVAYGHHPDGHHPGTHVPSPLQPPPQPPMSESSIVQNDGMLLNEGPDLTTGDITEIANNATTNTDSDDGGYTNGTKHVRKIRAGVLPPVDELPADGRVYFIRLKHDHGAWNAYTDGTQRLQGFMNRYAPCESEPRAVTSAYLRDKLMAHHQYPAFIYLYCDDAFTLEATDVDVLRTYLRHGGFLFLDSRPDPEIMQRVSCELEKVLPGAKLNALPPSHPINSFLFRLTTPGVGENVVTMRNYGITCERRLAVFYTMGNFAHLYAAHQPDDFAYITAQYQMGVNIMLYAIRGGNDTQLAKQHGVDARVTVNALERCFPLSPSTSAGATPRGPGTVKLPTDAENGSSPSETPAEINLLP